jgi:hypothetical protein
LTDQVERRLPAKAPPPGEIIGRHEELAARAEEVLRKNDMGGGTRAAPELYPHQWSWDSAFIAIAAFHQIRGAGVSSTQLLARADLAGHQLALVVVARAPR